jgi:predicted NBD/HSP70 family sugar kinase
MNVAVCDWGGSNTRSCVLENDGKDLHLAEGTSVILNTEGMTSIDDVLDRGIGASIDRYNGRVHGVSTAFAGPIKNHRWVRQAPNIHCIRGLPYDLGGKLHRKFHVPAVVGNDLEDATMEEHRAGAIQGMKNALVENVGTGWGEAYVLDGKVYPTEAGHAWLPTERTFGKSCGCGRQDCVESSLSGGAIKRRVLEICHMSGLKIPEGMHPCAFLDQEFLGGTPWAVELYEDLARKIGNVIGGNLNRFPEIEGIAYMGSFMECAMRMQSFRDRMRSAMLERSMFPGDHEAIPIREVQGPRIDGQYVGAMYGAASSWQLLNEEGRATA